MAAGGEKDCGAAASGWLSRHFWHAADSVGRGRSCTKFRCADHWGAVDALLRGGLHGIVLSGGAHSMRGLVGPAAGAPGWEPFIVSGDFSSFFLLLVCRMTAGVDFAALMVLAVLWSGILGLTDSFSVLPIAAMRLGYIVQGKLCWSVCWGALRRSGPLPRFGRTVGSSPLSWRTVLVPFRAQDEPFPGGW